MYASVIVDLSGESVDRLFTYMIPEEMNVSPGDMVCVPFGNKRLDGFVIEVKEHTSLAPERVKRIEGVAMEYPAILPELITLAQWMRVRYNCNLADALRLMIPAELRGGRVREKVVRVARLLISPEEARALCKRASKQLTLIDLLSGGAKPVPFLSSMLEGAGAAVGALQKKGVLEITTEGSMRRPPVSDEGRSAVDPPLMCAQQAAADELIAALRGGGGRFLLNGVTGSGKTEVYIRLIRAVLSEGKCAIVLVPEIALTPQMVGWFHARFGDDAAVIHSRLSAGERFDEWRRIRMGEAHVVIGARSAVFAPVARLGAIIIDEEHENTYQSEHRPRYDAREVAQKRAEAAGAVLLLGSATPSIASYMRTMPGVRPENKLTLLELPERVMGRDMPEVTLVDMRNELELGNHTIFSAKLLGALRDCLSEGHQAILFINRRGHSTFVSCRACGYVVKCGECDVSMTYHLVDGTLKCHYCGATETPPAKCPQCGSPFIKYFGIGTQKVESAFQEAFPGVPAARMDVDTTQGKDAHAKILSAFRKGETKVLIGTQMIAKGLDFPNVTLVGVVAADLSLNLPDFRSVERTFQLITQVAGRAGRADAPGRVIVQTYSPEHYGLQCAAKQDYRAFYHLEANYRRQGLYPPYTVITRIVVSGKDEDRVVERAFALEKELNRFVDAEALRKDVLQLRAVEAPIKKLRAEFRWQVFVKLYARGDVARIEKFMEELASDKQKDVRCELEVNPANMI